MGMKSLMNLVFVVALFMSHGYNILTVEARILTEDMFDCVVIDKQRAFDNPLLKDHKIQVEPTFSPEVINSTQSSLKRDWLRLRLNSIECPAGTIPILRVRKRDFAMSQVGSVHPSAEDQDQFQQHYSVVRVTGEYYGAQASMNVLKPQVSASQMSLAVIRIQADNSNMIQAGWAVAPQIYDDSEPRFTIYFRGDNIDCYNLLCAGFVQVDAKFPLGFKLPPSIKDGTQTKLELLIHQDKITKDWWLSIPSSNINVGYWPATLFSKLKNSASLVAFGGFVTSSLQEPSPAMGYGTFPEGNYERSGFFVDMQIVDGNGQKLGIGDSWVENSDSPKCYNVKRYGPEDGHGYSMEYGGPGGKDC